MAGAETPALPSHAEVAETAGSPVFVTVCVVLLVLIVGGIAGTIYLQRQAKAKSAAQQGQSQPPESAAPSSTTSNAPSPAAPAAESVSSGQTTVSPAPSQPSPAPATATPAPQPVSPPAVAASIRAMKLGSYPGATPVAIATLTGETVVAGFLTRDTPQQVMQYYKVRFPLSATTESEGKTDLTATLPDGARIRIHAEPQGQKTQVLVLQEN
jgi:hypothetical protein